MLKAGQGVIRTVLGRSSVLLRTTSATPSTNRIQHVQLSPSSFVCQPTTTTTTTACTCASCNPVILQQKRYFSTDDNSKSAIVSQADLELAVQAVAENEHTGLTHLPGAQKGGKKLAIVFTCKVCNTRAAKQFTEHAYQYGVVLVRCPGCEKYHLIADRLNFFGDDSWDIEKFMASMGENVRAVTNDNVLELTVEDLMGEEKMRDFRDGRFQADEVPLADDERPK